MCVCVYLFDCGVLYVYLHAEFKLIAVQPIQGRHFSIARIPLHIINYLLNYVTIYLKMCQKLIVSELRLDPMLDSSATNPRPSSLHRVSTSAENAENAENSEKLTLFEKYAENSEKSYSFKGLW